jgi:hypothetical protein
MKKKIWVNKFEVVGIKAGVIVMPAIGTLDLSNPDLPMEKVQKAFDLGCPYLKLKDPETPTDSEKAEAKTDKETPKHSQKKRKKTES